MTTKQNDSKNFQEALDAAKRHSAVTRCLVYQVAFDSFVTTWTPLCSGTVVAAFEGGKPCGFPEEFNCR